MINTINSKNILWGLGIGDIGGAVAKIAAAFGCEVCYYSTSGKNDNKEWRQVDFETALKCDIISIHAPLNENTKGLFGAKEIAKLKTGALKKGRFLFFGMARKSLFTSVPERGFWQDCMNSRIVNRN